MIAYFTDNSISQSVINSLPESIIKRHIKDFSLTDEAIFYGILRGSGWAMKYMRKFNKDYYYIDNGYFDAEYISRSGHKNMTGQLRIVKNDMIEKYPHDIEYADSPVNEKLFMLVPPSVYTANFYDTTPEDWTKEWARILKAKGYHYYVRTKDTNVPLEENLKEILQHGTGIITFNSMIAMSGIERGIPMYDTHGLLRNAYLILEKDFIPKKVLNFEKIKGYYLDRQLILDGFREINESIYRLG